MIKMFLLEDSINNNIVKVRDELQKRGIGYELVKLYSHDNYFYSTKCFPTNMEILDKDYYIAEDIGTQIYKKSNILEKYRGGVVSSYGTKNLTKYLGTQGIKDGIGYVKDIYELYGILGDELLSNSEVQIGRLNTIAKKLDDGWQDEVYIKPISPIIKGKGEVKSVDYLKSMTKDKTNGKWNVYDYYYVAKVEEIDEEYRVYVEDGDVLTGSMYKPKISKGIPIDVRFYTEDIVRGYKLEGAFVLDIARTPNRGLKVMGSKNISTSELYESDVTRVIDILNNMSKPL